MVTSPHPRLKRKRGPTRGSADVERSGFDLREKVLNRTEMKESHPMTEEAVWIDAGPFRLEGLYSGRPGGRAVLVTHPHPLYGGNMLNNVVDSVIKAYGRRGHSTLRFNFRGVGKSGGAYGEGVGEQDDVAAALGYLLERGKARPVDVDLAGYSFGAWVNARGLTRLKEARRVILISPPVAFLDFSSLPSIAKIELVIVGDCDEFAPEDQVRRLVRSWNPHARLHVVSDADHFYLGATSEIETILDHYLGEM
jgi:alpha/beta superfamily hydrolase